MAGLDPAISVSTVPREMAGSGAGHDAKDSVTALILAPMGSGTAMTIEYVNLSADWYHMRFLCDLYQRA